MERGRALFFHSWSHLCAGPLEPFIYKKIVIKKKTIHINHRLDNNLVYVYGICELIEQLAFVNQNVALH